MDARFESVSSPISVRSALATGGRHLQPVSPTAGLDAQVLLGHVLTRDTAWLIAHCDDPLHPHQHCRYWELIERRRQGEPVAYLTGRKDFWSLSLHITPAVLIPRPETELVVDRALMRLPRQRAVRVLDLGTGSGAIALAIAGERPLADITAVDSCPEALDVARGNARRLGLDNVRFAVSDWFTALAGHTYDLLVSNPPYVAAGDPHLRRGDTRSEPQAALVSGEDGLRDIRILARRARSFMNDEAWLILEHGSDQQAGVAALLHGFGYLEIANHLDLAGHPRVTECQAPGR